MKRRAIHEADDAVSAIAPLSLMVAAVLTVAALAFIAPNLVRSPPPARAHVAASAASEEAQIRDSLSGTADAATASFEDAQAIGAKLATILADKCEAGEPMPSEAVEVLRTLVSTASGARGWFVTLLTDPAYEAVFRPPIDAQLLEAIEASPDPNLKLLTMNVAMSTATELVHTQNGSDELAAASRLTRERSKVLLTALLPRMRGLVEEVQRLRTAVEPWPAENEPAASADDEWVKFTRKWRYGAEQRAAIKAVLDELLAFYDEPPPFGGIPPELLLAAGYLGYAAATGSPPFGQ